MSGTSMDGLDCGLFEISLTTDNYLNWEFIDYTTVSYSKDIRESICNALVGDEALIDAVDRKLGKEFSLITEQFINGRNTLLILLIGQAVNAMSGSVGVIMQMTGKEKQFQNILFFALLINISLNLFLIPVHGILGAAIASTISIIFWNITSVLYIYRKLHVLTFINFIKKP